ncbi:MAG TPA: ABC transporter permease [Oscillatoriaceae cyanobacterium M33_DOE_052]|uniref:ABC transporter permease n=1 Tax=Planktothricoides sp. SpSt-374 TaxID=2282167 RepID=A0A7C3ZWR2_9CYAN|nr:ABC transporter permease [Oscillatoriaceae cyanobacterium M33_DOE_052]
MILPSLLRVSLDEFLLRLRSQPESNIWSALVVSPSNFDEVIEDLQSGIEILAECEVSSVSGDAGVLQLCHDIDASSVDYLLLWNFESWHPDAWRQLDSFRSRLNRQKRGGVVILSSESAKLMVANAPNFFSWLSPRVYSLNLGAEFLTAEEREERLSALREWSGQSDAEVIALAEAKELPAYPEYGEWLLLLNREDLIER